MPADPKTNKEPDENLTASRGPEPPRRSSRRPEDNYPEFERRDEGVNPKDAGAPGGPVNIGVKGGAERSAPDDAVRQTPQATGRGSRDAPGGLPEE